MCEMAKRIEIKGGERGCGEMVIMRKAKDVIRRRRSSEWPIWVTPLTLVTSHVTPISFPNQTFCVSGIGAARKMAGFVSFKFQPHHLLAPFPLACSSQNPLQALLQLQYPLSSWHKAKRRSLLHSPTNPPISAVFLRKKKFTQHVLV